eukprot:TRINITY_DN4497_c0_g2_i1.p1 TRINITY_DN4497_c0_g2~~TRINITY_DN4497_c0_g2_i1.p1  ORF type:complete len:346 (+),score=56.08 TRINITY_DN4497_c0_g2_i1:67-1104(+)
MLTSRLSRVSVSVSRNQKPLFPVNFRPNNGLILSHSRSLMDNCSTFRPVGATLIKPQLDLAKVLGPQKQLKQPSFFLQLRNFARQRVQVRERDPSTSTHQRGTLVKKDEPQGEEKFTETPDVPTEQLITPEISHHLMKVYGTLGLTSLFAATGSFLSFLAPPAMVGALSLGGVIGGFGLLLALIFTDRNKVNLREKMLYGFGFLQGLGIASLLATIPPATIFLALAGTAAIFGGFSIAALKAKSKTFLALGGALFGALLFLIVASLATFIGSAFGLVSATFALGFQSFYLYAGLGIFSLFVAYDTQQMIDAARNGDKDHVSQGLNLFLDVWNLFVLLLQILRRDD